jgi:hypothetical protein
MPWSVWTLGQCLNNFYLFSSQQSVPSNLSSSYSNSPSSFLLATVAPAFRSVANTVSSSTSNAANMGDRLKLFYSSPSSSISYMITSSNVWCLIPININDQLESLIKTHIYELALSLIQSYQAHIEVTNAMAQHQTAHPFTNPDVFSKKPRTI